MARANIGEENRIKDGAGNGIENMLRQYADRNTARLHVPGHKGKLSEWDVTELADTDDLQCPVGAIRDAQAAIALKNGAKHCFMLVNGATAGNMAMMLALGEGKHVLVARDAHRSVISGIAMAAHRVSFVDASPVVRPEAVSKAFDQAGDICALLITSPNYYGQCAEVEAIARIAHERGARLLVDESHGAHFPYSRSLPESAGQWADMWVHSAHKTLFALTQGALLFAQGEAERLRRVLSLLQTSSPSFPIMHSLERSFRIAETVDWDAAIARCDGFRERVSRMPGLALPHVDDPLRLVVDVSGRGWTGVEAAAWLREKGVSLEMADRDRLVGIASPMDEAHWLNVLANALEALPAREGRPRKAQTRSLPARVMRVRTALLREAEYVRLEAALGRIAAQAAGEYPPGIAAVWPGEVVDEPCVRRLWEALDMGLQVFGLEDGRLACVCE